MRGGESMKKSFTNSDHLLPKSKGSACLCGKDRNDKGVLDKERQEACQLENLLRSLILSDTVSAEETAVIDMLNKKKRDLVMKIYRRTHPNAKEGFYHTSRGYFRSRNPDFSCKTEMELLEKLYEYYFSDTLETIYYRWISQCVDEAVVSPKTIQEYNILWKRFFQDSEIARKCIRNITQGDIKHLFKKWTGAGLITKKDFTNRKSVLNNLFVYALDNELISLNPLQAVSTRSLRFRMPGKNIKAYTPEQRIQLLNYLNELTPQTGYSLAARLCLYIPIRIGEIRGIKASDLDLKTGIVNIRCQLRTEREISVDVSKKEISFGMRHSRDANPKGNPEYSIRTVPLTPEAIAIIREARRYNPFGDYLFMEYGRPLNSDTFNDWLRKYSKAAGVPYLSSHKLRFTVASILYNGGHGIDLKQLQRILGHSNLAMTLHYVGAYDGDQQMPEIAAEMDKYLHIASV